jgi:hypothetical protein
MKTRSVFVGLILFSLAAAQQQAAQDGMLYGVAITCVGDRAKGVALTAMPIGVPLATALPHTKTNQFGEYRFKNLPWCGKYTVYADDEKAGFSTYSTGTVGNSETPEVEITPAANLRRLLRREHSKI